MCFTYVGVTQQLHDPHLPEELHKNKQTSHTGCGVKHVERVHVLRLFFTQRPLRVTFPDERDREWTFEVTESVHFLFVGEVSGGEANKCRSLQYRHRSTPNQFKKQTLGLVQRCSLGIITHSATAINLQTQHQPPAGLSLRLASYLYLCDESLLFLRSVPRVCVWMHECRGVRVSGRTPPCSDQTTVIAACFL